ncbi:hypothetical protein D3C87_1881710 [compost metagenome]
MTGAAVLIQPDVHIGQQAQTYLAGVDERHVLLDEPLLLETADSTQARAGRQRYAVGQFLVAEATVPLQLSQNP